MKKASVLAALTAALVALAGCGGGSSTGGSGAGGGGSAAIVDVDSPAATRAESLKAHSGGTMRLLSQSSAGSLDPQVSYATQYWQLYISVYDGLMTYKKIGGEASVELVPDLAEAIPTPTDGGKRYVFRIRDGLRFSDGSSVDPSDFAASMRRLFKVNGPTAFYYTSIVGGEACIDEPATCKLEGVVPDDAAGTLTIRLVEPDPEMLDKLALAGAVALPSETPAKEQATKPIPGTGAYQFTKYDPAKQLVMERNPHFEEWSAEAQPAGYPDKVVFDFGLTVEAQVTAIQNGQADWTYNAPPADRLTELGTRFAEQVHVSPALQIVFAPLNVNIAPFDDPRAREAVNLAIDRGAIVDLFGGANLADPTCQVLPPGVPGYEAYCPWSDPAGRTWTAPDLERAKQLVEESGTAGQTVTVVVTDDQVYKGIGSYLQSVLSDIGYDAKVKTLSEAIQTTYIQNTRNRVQMSVLSWYQDYPAPSNYLQVLLSCAAFTPNSDSSINIAGFCDEDVDRRMNEALALQASDEDAAAARWASIDRDVTDRAVWAPLFLPKHVDFVSDRLGNFMFSLQANWLITQSWVR